MDSKTKFQIILGGAKSKNISDHHSSILRENGWSIDNLAGARYGTLFQVLRGLGQTLYFT